MQVTYAAKNPDTDAVEVAISAILNIVQHMNPKEVSGLLTLVSTCEAYVTIQRHRFIILDHNGDVIKE